MQKTEEEKDINIMKIKEEDKLFTKFNIQQ